jgi:hypothetical protein
MLVVPVFNLVAPVVAIAFMVHLAAPLALRGRGGAAPLKRSVGEASGNSTRERRKRLTSQGGIANPS